MEKIVRIGGASAQLLDSVNSVQQLLGVEQLDYLVFDYLGEGSMGHLSMMSKMSPEGGYAGDFVNVHMLPNLAAILARGIRVVANAGGVDPGACAAALRKAAEAAGLKPRIAHIEGDDLRARIDELAAQSHRDMFDGREFPQAVESINAYLGAFPIAEALALGADIVIVGRSVDSAVTLGPLIHEFGWREDAHDLLAAGTLIGHLLECGTQVTGGTYTDWREVPDWANGGFPVAECHADGSAVITKPEGTGGCVLEGTVIEQMLYEVSDPQAYLVPDVSCDFSQVRVESVGRDRVRVSGARGRAPSDTYKVCATYHCGWRCTVMHPIVAIDAVARAERQAAALFKRGNALLAQRGLQPWLGTHVDVIGSEATFGAHARAGARRCREVMCRMVVEHRERAAVELFGRESFAALTTMSAGSLMPVSPVLMPSLRVFSFLLHKSQVAVRLRLDGESRTVTLGCDGGFDPQGIERAAAPVAPEDTTQPMTEVPLVALALGRSGEKGNLFNVAVIARSPEYLPWLSAALDTGAVADWYAHLFDDVTQRRVERFEVPGVHAINFVVHECLGGGIMGSMRIDAAAKGMAQLLMEFPVRVPLTLARQLDPALLEPGSGEAHTGAP
jgi:hypothetical protein